MWPTQVSGSSVPSLWSERRLRSRVIAIVAIAALMVGAALAAWLSTRGGQPATPRLYGTAAPAPAALWTWDGTSYAQHTVPANGPSSNHADVAYDRARGLIVLWDHGCASLVMGFQGGCVSQVNRTWTWDGGVWTAHSTQSSPTVAGQGAMLFDRKLGEVVYVNGAGRAWTWSGSDWKSLALPAGPAIQSPTVAAGYDEGGGLLVLVSSTATWLWDGSSWKTVPGGIDSGEARADAHLVYDGAQRQLVYVGIRATWTWDGSRWQQHAQPGISSGTIGYDAAGATVMLVQPDISACDRTACRTTTWAWDSTAWTQLPVDHGPLLPLTRSGAFGLPMAFDEARGMMVLFASGA
jgi:hypothetical protein